MNVSVKYHTNDLSKRDEREDITYFRIIDGNEITRENLGIFQGDEETIIVDEMVETAREKIC